MPEKQIFTRYKNHNIRVVNTWLSGCSLYIDDVCVDTSDALFVAKGKTPQLSAILNIKGFSETIEVFVQAILTVKMQIHANGRLISGEKFIDI